MARRPPEWKNRPSLSEQVQVVRQQMHAGKHPRTTELDKYIRKAKNPEMVRSGFDYSCSPSNLEDPPPPLSPLVLGRIPNFQLCSLSSFPSPPACPLQSPESSPANLFSRTGEAPNNSRLLSNPQPLTAQKLVTETPAARPYPENRLTTLATLEAPSTSLFAQPQWYRDLKPNVAKKRNAKDGEGAKNSRLRRIRDIYSDWESNTDKAKNEFFINLVREEVHNLMFLESLSAMDIKKAFLLHKEHGIPRIILDERFPKDVRDDAEFLWHKWAQKDFNIDILWGVIVAKADPESGGKTGDRINPEYWSQRRKASEHGHNGLRNGQWWPRLICAFRDGAHGVTQGGIHPGPEGAYSIVVTGGGGYGDKDLGDEILYEGTNVGEAPRADGRENITEGTRSLIRNYEHHRPVRVIRSDKTKNLEMAPQCGYRYDGLYDVIAYECEEPALGRYSFRLKRCAGQDEIRTSGSRARPFRQEIEAYQKTFRKHVEKSK